MRFTLAETTALSPFETVQLARLAEQCGYDSFAMNDGTFQMRETRGIYPFSADHRRNWDIKKSFLEPMTLLPALAMQTKRIRFFTGVIKLPLHHPLILAKQIATAAIMSNDRFALGVGASWAPEEYEFCGVDWSKRGKIMNESLEVLRLVLSGDVVEYHGEIFNFEPLTARPAPRRPVKIFMGGHQEPTLRRAAKIADGWIASGPPSISDLRPLVSRLRELCDEYGRNWHDFEIHARPLDVHTLDDFKQLQDLGVTDTALTMGTGSTADQRINGEVSVDRAYSTTLPQAKIDAVRQFSENIICHFAQDRTTTV